MRHQLITVLVASFALQACVGEAPPDIDEGSADVGDQEPMTPADDHAQPQALVLLALGSYARVCNATALNQRSGPGVSYSILKVLPSGSTTKIVGMQNGWYQHDWNGSIGWSSGNYLCAVTSSEPPPTTTTGDGLQSTTISRDSFISIAQASVGFSYWWGGGRLATGASLGSCSGSCPNCSHSGSYGADCSGFIGKAWLLPAALPMDANKHPYSTETFNNSSSLWSTVSRSALQRGDSLVYRSGSVGHILMYDKDDPWGSFWSYEARGCSYGIVHNIRTAGSAYKGIRRTGV
jgi:hypothetical protein